MQYDASMFFRIRPRMAKRVSQRRRIVRFSLMFAAICFGVALALIWRGQIRIGGHATRETTSVHEFSDDFSSRAVRLISTTDDFYAVTATGNCVLFVNCDWVEFPVAFRQPFSEFARWCRENTDYKTVTVKLKANSHDELWSAIQDLWAWNHIFPGGLKTYGGAGRVVWFKGGRVVDYAWCSEVLSVDKLKLRSTTAFR
jgi:hypothetical protein